MYQANEHSGPVVYSTDKRPRPEPVRRTLSIKFVAYVSASVIISLFLGITAANLMLARDHYQSGKNDTPPHLVDKATAIEAQLAVFNQIVKHVASQPTTQDILEHKNKPGSQAWALQMRRFLPQALGVALLTPNGKVLGEPSGQQLTPQCLTDMAKISQKETTMSPAVHQDPTGTTHYDLTAHVLDETENPIGMLFVSFTLDTLKPLLQGNSNTGTRLSLLDGHGDTITQYDDLQSLTDTRTTQIPIAGTDWKLSLIEPAKGLQLSFLTLAVFNISAILLTIGVISFLVRYIMRSMGTDFEQVKSLLNNLAEGAPLEEELATPRLRETAEVFPAITQLHRNLNKKEQLLEHQELSDKLTGLSNRRQFNIEFARAYDFARRGTPVCVVLMRLTGLEKLNQNQANQVVKILGKTLKEHARKVDHAARLDYGEFALLMFGASPEGTTPCLERLCRSFRKHQSEHPSIPKENICPLYCGYTRIHAHRDSNAAEVLKRTETALAEAQESTDHHIISA